MKNGCIAGEFYFELSEKDSANDSNTSGSVGYRAIYIKQYSGKCRHGKGSVTVTLFLDD